jgi:SSS family solute:Na+ symporter
LGFSVLVISALKNINGGLATVWAIGSTHGKLRMFDFSVNFHEVDNFWALMIGNIVISVQTMGTDQAVLQKYFTTKSKRETSKSLLFYGLVSVPVVCLLSLLGIIWFVFYEQHPQLKASLHNPDAIVPYYAAQMLPHGLVGLFVASIFAGSMSTISASLNSLATSSVVDIYQRLIWKHGADSHYTRASRVATFFWGAAATGVAFYAGRLGALIMAFPKIQSLFGGIILVIFLLGLISRRINSTGVFLGVVGGVGVVTYIFLETSVSLYWYCVIGVLTTVAVGWLFGQLFLEPPRRPEEDTRPAQELQDVRKSSES